MKEAEHYSELRPFFARLFAVDRVENAILPGMPDVILGVDNRTLFVEMKAKIGKHLRGSQVAWCLKRYQRGCTEDMFVVTRDEDRWLIFNMVDVALNAGLVTYSLEHDKFRDPEVVARHLYQTLKETK